MGTAPFSLLVIDDIERDHYLLLNRVINVELLLGRAILDVILVLELFA